MAMLETPFPVKHKKTGNIYRVIGYALNCNNDVYPRDEDMIIYEKNGSTFVRKYHEFQEKFEEME